MIQTRNTIEVARVLFRENIHIIIFNYFQCMNQTLCDSLTYKKIIIHDIRQGIRIGKSQYKASTAINIFIFHVSQIHND